MKQITVYNLGNLPVADVSEFIELQEDFKLEDTEKLKALQMIIIERGFKYAFTAWQDEDGKLYIIDAHQRKKALMGLRQRGWDIPPIPYQPIQAASKKEAVEEIAAFNSSFATINQDSLLFERYEIDRNTLDTFELPFEPIAFETPESASTLDFNLSPDSEIEDVDDVEVDVPDESKCISRLGDVWVLGDHRLVCGDCQSKKFVDLLMQGEKADLCVTDPPYNVSYVGETEEQMTIENDSMSNDEFLSFLRQVFKSIKSVMHEGAAIYVFHADTEGSNFRRAFVEAGFKFAQCCIWMKNSFAMGRQDYQWQHEPVLYGWVPGAAHKWYSDRRQSTVWQFDRPQRNAIHPTMKPIPLIAYPIQNSSQARDTVIDFFSGSGSTLIACEKTDRICRAIELDPRYVDASVRRYRQMFPGKTITLIRDGERKDIVATGL